MAGERRDADYEAAEKFTSTFSKYLEENDINWNDVYNMDETALFWKSLPRKTLAPSTVKQISGGKTKKDRITVGLCANITGSHKLSPLFVHKFKKPRALKSSNNLLIVYKAQQNTWVDRTIFKNWLENFFKPAVKKEQLRTNRVGKIVLLVDNCSSHVLPAKSLDNEDFQLLYLPANTTSILQPMDQGVIAKFKLCFRHKLAKELLKYNIRDCINLLDTYWQEVTAENINNSWKRLLGNKVIEETDYEEHEEVNTYSETSIAQMLQISEEEIADWITSCDTEENRFSYDEGNENEAGKEEEEEEEEGDSSTQLQFKEHEVAKALNLIVAWSKQYDPLIQKYAKALNDHFQEHRE
uniref:jerky protein homolog n=1 Tax=Osmia lignaria TaxID=473952 RepID=UPI0014796600|nr:jerky protein homolog [Osmia lignaria]XP_034195320.1 jerky protein homolog [Osmia lignaria]